MKLMTKVMLVLSVFGTGLMAAEDLWTENFEAAKKEAKKTGKDLIMNFTGSDWCIWCKRLEGEVFSKEYFQQEAPKDFIFVKVDFPQDKSKQSQEIKDQNNKLASEYSIQGYPTIILATADGETYFQTGYRDKGPEEYVEHIRAAKNNEGKAKNAIAKAYEEKDDAVKVKKLDETLSKLSAESAEKYFSDDIDNIIELDKDNKLGIRNKYLLPKELKAISGLAEDPAAFIEKADEIAKKLNLSGDELKMIEDIKLDVQIHSDMTKLAEFNDDADKMLKGFDEIVSKYNLTGEYKQQILAQKIFIHLQLNDDIDAALKAADEAIAAAPDSETTKHINEFKERLIAEKEKPAEEETEEN